MPISNNDRNFFAFSGLVSNSEELPDIPHLQNVSSQNYIPDAALPPGEPWLQGGPTRAVLSLPSCLCLCEDIAPVVDGTGCVSEQLLEEIKVYGKRLLEPGVLFGPYLGEMCKERTPTQLKYAWAVSIHNMSVLIRCATTVYFSCYPVQNFSKS